MRALVTGGTGFIGNVLALYLARNGWDVTCLVRRPIVSRMRQIDCVTNPSDVPQIDRAFHLAATVHHRAFTVQDFMYSNGGETCRMLELAESLGAKSFVYTSTQLVIGKPVCKPFATDHATRPQSPYALSKLAGELACEYFRQSGRLATTSLRLTSVIGNDMPRTSVLPRFVENALVSNDLDVHGSGARVQNFVHVDDVVRACVNPASGVLNIGGDSISMRDLAELVVRSTPGSASSVVTSGLADPQEDYRWIPALDNSPCVRLESFLPSYINHIANPQPREVWWRE